VTSSLRFDPEGVFAPSPEQSGWRKARMFRASQKQEKIMFDLTNEFEKAQQRSLQYLDDLTRLWHLLVYTEELEEAEKKRHANIKKVYAMAEAELKKRKAAAPKPPRPRF
jgi:predicted  nucleic acid-binding Zn-ribbon protein